MAEAAALALAAIVNERMNLSRTNFLADNLQLVQFLNASDISNPPDWRIKYYTQIFSNCTGQSGAEIFKINRNLNQTADTLARQALAVSQHQNPNFACVCSNTAHVTQCPLLDALTSVALNSVRLLAAGCC
jgi:hypothetical protein